MSLLLNIHHRMDDFVLQADVEAPAGVTALFGPSGSGKTTLIRAVAGLIRPKAGRIEIDGTVLFDADRGLHKAPHERRVGYVFQDARLFPHRTVLQNLRYGARPNSRQETSVIDMLGIGHLLKRRPSGLSGGEKQRVAIGRALLTDPKVLLMDEPLAALDSSRKAEILPYLERLRDHAQIPILYVSHSASETARLATSVAILDDGRVVTHGDAAQIMSDPQYAAQFGIRQAGAVLSARVVDHASDGLTALETAGGPVYLPKIDTPLGLNIRVRILAQDVMLSLEPPKQISALNVLKAQITTIREGQGPGAMVGLQIGREQILARITKRSAEALNLAPGLTCYAVLKSVAVAQSDIGAQPKDTATLQ